MSAINSHQETNYLEMKSEVEQFIEILLEQKHYSPLTCKNYSRQLTVLLEYLHQQNISAWHLIKPIHIRQLAAKRHRLNQSAKSIALLLSSCRSFFQYLIDRDQLKINPAKNIRPPKGKKTLPKVVEVDQINLLLDGIDDEKEIGMRDKAVAELFYSSGLRLAELASCNLSDLDLNQRLITVIGKGRKTRVLPVGKKAKEAIDKWLKVRELWLLGEQTDAVFISKRRSRLSHRSIQQRMEYWGKRIGVNTNLHPHKFRHSCATHVLESSGDIRAVQELLGHASISTTQIYTHLDFQKLAEVYDKAHPRAKK